MEKSGHFSSDSRASRLKVDPEGLSPRTSRSLRLRAEKGLRQRSPAFELREEAAAVREMFATAAGERRGELGAEQGIQSDSRVPSLLSSGPFMPTWSLPCNRHFQVVTMQSPRQTDRGRIGGTSPSPHTAAGPRAALRSLSCPVHSRRPSPLASASTSLGRLLGRRTRPLSPSSPSPGCLVLLRPLWLESPFYCYRQARKH